MATPQVLLAVDPTSAVDAATEAIVVERLVRARKGRTTVVTSTSVLMLAEADHVHVVAGDRLVASGTHASLLRDEPDYAALVLRGRPPIPPRPTTPVPRDRPPPHRQLLRGPPIGTRTHPWPRPRRLRGSHAHQLRGGGSWAPRPVACGTDLVNGVEAGRGLAYIDRLGLLVVAAAVLQFAIGYVARYLGYRFGERTAARLREQLTDSLMRLPARTVERTAAGDLTSRATTDAGLVATVLRLMPRLRCCSRSSRP